MAYAFVQQKSNESAGTGASSIATGNTGSAVVAGNTLVAFVFWGGAVTLALSDTNGTNDVWTQCGSTIDYGATYHLAMFRLENAASGVLNLQCVFTPSDALDPAIAVYEFSGLDTAGFDKTTGIIRTNPGTGTDAITSGNTAALASQPQMVIAFAADVNTHGTVAAGTGYSSSGLTPVWTYGGANYTGLLEHKRVTATTAVNGTFTDASFGDASEYGVFVATFAESGGGPTYTLMGQACL